MTVFFQSFSAQENCEIIWMKFYYILNMHIIMNDALKIAFESVIVKFLQNAYFK